MKSLVLLAASVLLSLAIAACGSSGGADSSTTTDGSTTATSATSAEPVQNYTKPDSDKDNDFSPADDTNNNETLNYGHEASPADKQAVTALIRRYYTAALKEEGAQACSMLYITLEESVAEDDGYKSPGPTYLRQGKTCPEVMDLLFKHYHSQLVTELPLLKVSRVRLIQHHGKVILNFGKLPERQIAVQRERHTWKLVVIFDSELP